MLVVLVKVPDIVEPVPLDAIPVKLVVLVLDQVNVVPVALFISVATIFAIATPVHKVCVNGEAFTDGGLTVETTTTAEPVIFLVQVLFTLVATAVYVPGTV